ncbi:MAG: DoxX family protein [Chloroflexi bacterium]|nr:DoxX family protein [Chloroflexota bacterium]
MSSLRSRFNQLDDNITVWMARNGITLLRISLGIVFFWFGILKFFPNASPAEDLAARTIDQLTFGIVPPNVALPVLAAWEVLIGLGLITGKFIRATILLLVVQMLGTITPLFLFPSETWINFPVSPTLEGQYIIKNIVLVTGAIVVGATVRGGDLVSDKDLADAYHARLESEKS